MARTKNYQHFCPVARSLEVIGEKWSLLIVRDLLAGPLRFTDLMGGLSNITPKWLTQRLRDLEAEEILQRHQEEGRREVWYELTPKGRDLAQVIGALNVWGLRHAMREPAAEEVLGAPGVSRLMRSFEGFLIRTRVRPAAPVTWQFDFGNDVGTRFLWDGTRWLMSGGEPEAEVQVHLRPRDWAEILALPAHEKRARLETSQIEGDAARRSEFVDAVCSMSD
jgi:DNA-binding HxlR family transcriptional regulator